MRKRRGKKKRKGEKGRKMETLIESDDLRCLRNNASSFAFDSLFFVPHAVDDEGGEKHIQYIEKRGNREIDLHVVKYK